MTLTSDPRRLMRGGEPAVNVRRARVPTAQKADMPNVQSDPTRPHPVALVTGASAGLGRVFARQLAAGGYDCVLVARDRERLNMVARELEATTGSRMEVIAADLTVDADLQRVCQRISGSPVDVLVNNAGFGTKGALATTDPAAQEAMIRLHVVAVDRLTRAALPSMINCRRGAIITVSSVASFASSPGNVNYCATKAFERVAMEALAQEVTGSGVYVQALCPGFVRTEFHQRAAMKMSYVPLVLWLSADDVVGTSLRAMRRRRPTVVIPGWKYKAIVWLLRHLPQPLLARGSSRYRRDR